jgi:hypothetical protein
MRSAQLLELGVELPPEQRRIDRRGVDRRARPAHRLDQGNAGQHDDGDGDRDGGGRTES